MPNYFATIGKKHELPKQIYRFLKSNTNGNNYDRILSACRRDDTGPAPKFVNCSDINTDVVWEDRGDGIDYVNCVLDVNAKLTIAPRVTVQCKSNAHFGVNSVGALKAVGISHNQIMLKGDEDAAGVWKGLYFNSNHVENELNYYCQISNGGSSSFEGNPNRKANIRVANNAQIKILNSIVLKSAYDGLYVDGLDFDAINPVTVFNNNQFTNNPDYPISATAAMADVLDGALSTFTGNSKNKILLRGDRLYGSHCWKKLNIPLLIQDIVSVGCYNDNGKLTIQPGVTIELAGDAGLCTSNYSTGSCLKINGNAAERIALTGETPSSGAWKGVVFQSLSQILQ